MTERARPPIIISSCLVGEKCRYDGEDNFHPEVADMAVNEEVVLVCPEQLGGLLTPRPAAGRDGDRVTTIDGMDVTSEFNKGAYEVVKIARQNKCTKAILKARSPSCGVGKCIGVETLKGGDYQDRDGVTAEKLRELNMDLITEEDLPPS